MGIASLDDVLYHGLKDLLSAEKQFRDALSMLASAAEDNELKEAFETHHTETKQQIRRLEKCFRLLDRTERSEKCEAAAGLVKEGANVIHEQDEGPAKDVMLAAAGRKTEHYEIACYTDAIDWAKQLAKKEVADLLTETLKEEQEAAEKLLLNGERLAAAEAFASAR